MINHMNEERLRAYERLAKWEMKSAESIDKYLLGQIASKSYHVLWLCKHIRELQKANNPPDQPKPECRVSDDSGRDLLQSPYGEFDKNLNQPPGNLSADRAEVIPSDANSALNPDKVRPNEGSDV